MRKERILPEKRIVGYFTKPERFIGTIYTYIIGN